MSKSDVSGEPRTPQRQQDAAHSTLVSVVINTGLAGVQVVSGVLSHSQGLVADGLHSLADLLADAVVLVANRHSYKAADDDHPYGHHRFETAASLLLGLLLLAVGAHMLWRAFSRLSSAEPLPAIAAPALIIALIGIASKELLFRYLLRVAHRLRSSLLAANAWHARSDALSSLVVSIGIAGNLLGYRMADGVAALLVGVMVLRMGLHYAWEALNDLMDHSASHEETAAIAATLRATPGVLGLHNLRTRKVGDLLMVDVHIEVDCQLSVHAGHAIAEDAQARVLARHHVADVLTHLDPVSDETPD